MPYNLALAARIDRLLAALGVRFEAKNMMGGRAYLVNDKMCVGVENNRLMVRLDPGEMDAALSRPGCKPMDFTGRPMRGFVFVDASTLTDDRTLREWIDRALAFNPRATRSRRKKSATP